MSFLDQQPTDLDVPRRSPTVPQAWRLSRATLLEPQVSDETPADEPFPLEDPDMSLFLTAYARLLRYRAEKRQSSQVEAVSTGDGEADAEAA